MSRFIDEGTRRWLRRQADKNLKAEELDNAVSKMEVEIDRQRRQIDKLENQVRLQEREIEAYKTLKNGEMLFAGRLVDIKTGPPPRSGYDFSPPYWSSPTDGIDFTLHLVGQVLIVQQSRRLMAGRPISIRIMEEDKPE